MYLGEMVHTNLVYNSHLQPKNVNLVFVSRLQTLYRYVLDDLYEFPSLEKDLKELQRLLRMQRRQ